MKQPIKKNVLKNYNIVKNDEKSKTNNKILDGSGLETFFKKNVLDFLKIEYVQQFEAKSIGRFYDFYLPKSNILIEIDGTYWHTDPRVYDKPINRIQKRNKKVDELKTKWALIHGYILLRFWEEDIYKQPKKIISELNERIKVGTNKVLVEKSKKDGSFFIKKLKNV